MTTLARRVILLLIVAAAAGTAVGTTVAGFTATTSTTGPSFAVKRIFSAARTDSSWTISDRADGSASDESAATAYADTLFHTTKGLSTTWSTSRYIEFEYASSSIPAGLDPTSVTFDLDFADAGGGGGETTCLYYEVRRRSTGAVLGTHGSSGSPFACETTQTWNRTSTDITSEVPDAATAGDLAVRVYVQNSSATKTGRIDLAVVRFKRYTRSWTLRRTRMNDQSDGVAATTDWGPFAADGAYFETTGNWSNAFSGTRYVDYTIASNVPSGASVTSASLKYRYKSTTSGDNSCWYAQAISGGSVIGTYGSSGSPVSCNATTSFVTDTVSMPEVNTGPEASDLTIRVFMSNSGGRKTQTDLLEVTTNYSLSGTGCVAPGATTVTATGDTLADQSAPTSTAGATATEVRVKTQNGSRNKRSFFYFPLPSAPDGCSMTAATLRLNLTQVAGTRTLEAYRAASAWTEAGLSWNTMPATTGTAATTANTLGWRNLDVLTQVQAMYAGTNEGFVVKDSAEDAATAAEQRISSREGTFPPELVITFG